MTKRFQYGSPRAKAWRNIMVAAINAGLERELFSLTPGDNRWSGSAQGETVFWDFSVPAGLAGLAACHDGGFDELRIYAAVNPTPEARRWLSVIGGGWRAGEAIAAGWLERRTKPYLQTSATDFRCQRHMVPLLAAPLVEPRGFGDRGRVML